MIPKFPRRTFYTAYELAVDLDINKAVVDILAAAIRESCREHHSTGTSDKGNWLERSWKESWEWKPHRKPNPIVIPDLLEGTVCRRLPGVGYNWEKDFSIDLLSDEEDNNTVSDDESPDGGVAVADAPGPRPKGKAKAKAKGAAAKGAAAKSVAAKGAAAKSKPTPATGSSGTDGLGKNASQTSLKGAAAVLKKK